MTTTVPGERRVRAALDGVLDPEIGKPITELGMVKDVAVDAEGSVQVEVYLTVSGCPMRDRITGDVTAAVADLPGVRSVDVTLDVMSDEQRTALRERLHGPDREVPFAQPGSLTRVYCVASGKGGVGKSTVTANLAAAMAARGLSVGILDADIHGHSIPRALGLTATPTLVEKMIMPPVAHGVKVISMGMFTEDNAPVIWRGPMLHRALRQFVADVYWGDLDALLVDLPPGTGDVAISIAQLVPDAEVVVVTTPQRSAAEVAERAGTVTAETRQRVVGVVENMSWAVTPGGSRWELFGTGGGAGVAAALTSRLGEDVPLLGQVPLDTRLREAADDGVPLVVSDPASPAAVVLTGIAQRLAVRERGLAGLRLPVTTS